MKQTSKKGLIIMVVWMVVLFIVDLGTALLSYKQLYLLELNPIFVRTGSLIPLIILNIVFIAFFYFVYQTWRKPYVRFWLCNYFVWGVVARVYAIKSNLMAYSNPVPIAKVAEFAATYTTTVKTTMYFNTILVYVMPLIVTFVVYLVFIMDHEVKLKDEDKNDN